MGIQAKIPNPRNENILIFIDGKLYAREEAKISVFDSLVQGGDGVWEGLRLYDGKIFMLDKHLDRLEKSARTLCFVDIPDKDEIKDALAKTLIANSMQDGVHIRLTLSRGKKVTSGMSPHWNQYGSTLIIIPEWKVPIFGDIKLKLITSAIRRNSPDSLDSKIHHNNLINNILAKIQANEAGVDEAVMLDKNGFVAETNACNIFFVSDNSVITPTADYCLPGITRGLVIEICKENNISIVERNISISEMYVAEECFVTGTMGELTPVSEIDGRKINGGVMIKKMQALFEIKTKELSFQVPGF